MTTYVSRLQAPCPHGKTAVDGRYGGVWAAPFDKCQCCGIDYPYIDSASYSTHGESSGSEWTKGRCAECGGYYKKWSRSRGILTVDERRSQP